MGKKKPRNSVISAFIKRYTEITNARKFIDDTEKGLSVSLITLADIRHLAETYSGDLMNANERMCFTMGTIFLYSPSALFGKRLRNGLRQTLADVLHMKGCNVTRLVKNLLFLYEHDRHFADDVDVFLKYAMTELNVVINYEEKTQ